MLRASDTKLLVHGGVWLVLGSLTYGVMLVAAAADPGEGSGSALFMVDNPLLDAAYRVAGWPISTPLFVITSAFPFLIGVWAARRGVLEDPARHLRLLRRTSIVGVGLSVAGGLPLALVTSRVAPDPSDAATLAFAVLHTATGYAGGFGYAAVVGLIACRLGTRRGPVVTAVAACGQRSLTCYLLQSVAWLVLFAPYALDLGERCGVAASAAIGIGTWVATVLVAELLRRADSRGPAESLLRRMTYRTGPAG
jgi:uncharacterized membrane protein YeiB